MAKMLHTMIRVLNPKGSIEFYQNGFGLEMTRKVVFDSFTLYYLRNDECDMDLELTHNHTQTEAYDLGTGYGHLAFQVDDIVSEHERFTTLGFSPKKLVDFKHNGKTMAHFFFVQDPDGYSIEVLQK